MEENYYGVTRSNEYLAHYGIKGMHWGVRKAIEKGNNRKLSKQYAKAAKHLAKLEKRAASGKQYARRAATLGASAAAAGGLAALGASGVSSAMRIGGNAMSNLGRAAGNLALKIPGKGKLKTAAINVSRGIREAGKSVSAASPGVSEWGKQKSIGRAIADANSRQNLRMLSDQLHGSGAMRKSYDQVNSVVKGVTGKSIQGHVDRASKMSNNAYARLGAAGVAAGLGAGAAYNAYRAATTKRAAKKADAFRKEMNKAFAGTQFGGGSRLTKKKKRR